jgi:hypothetical protein
MKQSQYQIVMYRITDYLGCFSCGQVDGLADHSYLIVIRLMQKL